MTAGLPNTPLVSIVLPVYNGENLVSRAIQSVLTQDFADWELLIVDDGSTDGTMTKLEASKNDARVKILHHPNGANCGVCASRRLALEQARGEFVAFLDADDEFLPGKLARHIGLLQKNPRAVLLHGPVERRADNPDAAQWTFDLGSEPEIYDLTKKPYFLRRNYICNSTVVCRRSALRPDEDLPPRMIGQSEDWVLWNCVGLRGAFYYDPQPLTHYLDHEASYTSQMRRRPGAVENTAIEFYLCMLPRLPRLGLRLRALFALLYNLTALMELRRGPVLKLGFTARLLQRVFNAARKNPR